MRISDWSSDVCSSGLDRCGGEREHPDRLLRDRQVIIGVHRVAAQVMNELARLPIVSAQPSTRTNSSSLNGSEMIVGDSIIMPRLISTVATTRSMTMKGRKMRKPIWNAVLSSLVTNAGSATDHGTSAGDA